MGVQIVKLKPEQREEFKKIRLASLSADPHAFSNKKEDRLTDNDWIKRLQNEKRVYLFAKVDGQIIGMVGIAEAYEEANTMIVLGMYVDQEHRGKGVGKLLLQTAFKEIESRKDIKKLKLWVHESQIPAIQLYKHFGFTITGKQGADEAIDPIYHNTLIMEKIL